MREIDLNIKIQINSEFRSNENILSVFCIHPLMFLNERISFSSLLFNCFFSSFSSKNSINLIGQTKKKINGSIFFSIFFFIYFFESYPWLYITNELFLLIVKSSTVVSCNTEFHLIWNETRIFFPEK